MFNTHFNITSIILVILHALIYYYHYSYGSRLKCFQNPKSRGPKKLKNVYHMVYLNNLYFQLSNYFRLYLSLISYSTFKRRTINACALIFVSSYFNNEYVITKPILVFTLSRRYLTFYLKYNILSYKLNF